MSEKTHRDEVSGDEGSDSDDEITYLDVGTLQRAYSRRELSPVDVIVASAARIEATEPILNAFTTVCAERAEAEAVEAERRLAAGEGRALEGIPIAVKDLIDTADVRTTYGSAIYSEHVPDADAEAVRRAREAGAIVVGKTSTHEFAWGITSENPHYGPCRNPWDTDRVSGGSSGGSAVALATGSVPLAIGSDTGGSIRIPSAFCGIVGLKPTFGRISVRGVFPLVESMDHVGPMARTPRDAALLYSVLAGTGGPAAAGGTSAPGSSPAMPGSFASGAVEGAPMDGLLIGVSEDLDGALPTPEVDRVLGEAMATCERLGARFVELAFSRQALVAPTFATIQRVEAIREHRRRGIWPERAAEYSDDVRGRIEAGAELGIEDYLGAVVDRAALSGELAGLLADVDLLLTPIAAGTPALIGQPYEHLGNEVDFRTVAMSSTMGQNLAGLPSCAVRGGFDAGGIPVGVQFTGRHGAEQRVLSAAEAFAAATPEIQERRPQLSAVGRT